MTADNEFDAKCKKLLKRWKEKDLLFDYKTEFGKLLMIHIDDFTEEQKKRYDELKLILSEENNNGL
jgi:hypothetical protein